jgi:hypothetical protein
MATTRRTCLDKKEQTLMIDEKKESMAAETITGARPMMDPRPTDLQIFYALLPGVLGGFAGKSTDTRSANAMAFTLVREALGQCAMMGILRPVTVCNDSSPLATMPQNMMVPGVQQPVQHQPGNGHAVTQFPNQPGQGQAASTGPGPGGMVSQYPNQAPPQQQPGQQPNYGGGSRGVMVAQFPNGTNPPQL